MLCLNRKCGEQIVFPHLGISVKIVAVRGNTIKVGVEAPGGVVVHREEVWRKICALEAAKAQPVAEAQQANELSDV